MNGREWQDIATSTASEGWQSNSLTLVFRTTPDGLTRFLDASRLPTPAPSTEPTPGGQPLATGEAKCGLDDGFTYSAIVELDDTTYPGIRRSFAVDTTDSTTPRVLVVAAVL
jgi:hypothetical protein